jgi:hypothetical protein
MEYVIADSNDSDAFWFERNISTLALALQKVTSYPEAKYVLEYRDDLPSKGVLPTGKAWAIQKEGAE